MRVDCNTLIGRSPNEIVVAHKNNDVVIIGYCQFDKKASTSCIASVKNFAVRLNMQAVPDAVASPSLI